MPNFRSFGQAASLLMVSPTAGAIVLAGLIKAYRAVGLLIALSVALFGCSGQPATHQALIGGALPELLPVRAFVANTDFNSGYQVSPDGKKLAWMAVHGLAPAIFVKTIGQDDVRPMDIFSPDFRWAGDSRRLLLRKDKKGDENYHVWLVDTDPSGEPAIDLTPFDGARAEINAVDPEGLFVLVADNRRDARLFDLSRIDLKIHSNARIAENPGDVVSWLADPSAALRGRVRYKGESLWLELREDGNWRTLYAWTARDIVEVVSIDPEHQRIWLRSNRGRDKVALVAISTRDGAETVFHEDADVDVGEVGISRLSGDPLYATAYPDYPRLEVFDKGLRESLRTWRNKLMGAPTQYLGVEILGADRREENIVIGAYDHTGKRYFLWNRVTGVDTLLGSDALRQHANALAPIQPVSFRSRDGLRLHGYLTLPQGVSPRRLPMVLLVHGGPWERNLWADPDFLADALRVQFLANRGYAVLQVNYRGSTGYGRKFHEAAIGEFGGAMQDDLLDAVAWAIRDGYADAEHIAIMGASYGGYATLAALSQSPKVFACGVDIFGPSDLVSLLEEFPPYWRSALPMWHHFVGNPTIPEERRRLIAKSPLSHVSRIERPLLVIQGTGDVRSTVEQSDRMVAALREAGKPVQYMRISGMGHGTWHWPHNLRMYRRTEDFLSQCLGGRSSGFDYFEFAAWAL